MQLSMEDPPSGNTSDGDKLQGNDIVQEICSDVLSNGTLMLIFLDYLQMDIVDTVDEWIKRKQGNEKDELFNYESDQLFEPWLEAIAELCQRDQQELASFLSNTNIDATYLWFTTMTAAKSNNKELVLSLIDKLDPGSAWKPGCLEAKRVVIYSWLYIVWRFLVNLDEKKRYDKKPWQDVAFRRYSCGDGWTFLHFAAAWGDAKCVEELLKADINIVEKLVNAKTGNSYTALHLAAYHGNASIVKSLLQKGNAAACKEKDSKGRTPLHHASERGCVDSVKALLHHTDKVEVDAVDKNGMTPLHLAACRGHTAVVTELLLSKSAHPHVQCEVNHLMVQKLFITRLLKDRRERVWSTRFSISDPELEACYAANAVFLEPNQLQSEVWCPRGFNALHFAVVYGDNDTVKEILQHANKEEVMLAGAARDSLGLTPVDWAEAMGLAQAPENRRSNLLVKDAGPIFKNSKSSLLARDGLISINFEKAKAHWHQIREAEQERRKVQWAIDMSEAILSRRWAVAICITRRGVTDQIRIDDAVWDHLEKAIFVVLKFRGTPAEHRKRLVERMLVELVNGGALSKSSSIMQRCLKWAIKQEMVHLVKEIVRNTTEAGELLINLVEVGSAGSKLSAEKSPLEAASKINGPRGQEMVAAIEGQTDVKRLLLEGRQVYVEYANTILVGAVLVAALAFQGWVQTPQGYAGMPLDSTSKGMLLFARCNSFGFFFAMGAFMAGAVGAMPPKSGEFVKYRDKVVRAACVASLLMAVAVACQVVGFASALVSIQGRGRGNEDMLVSSRFGVIIIFILSGWFLARLNNVQNVVGLLLEALPRTMLYILMSIFNFWRLFPQSQTFRRFFLYPLYALVLAPLLDSPRFRSICPRSSTFQFLQPFQSKLQALRDSVNTWLQQQQDVYEGKEGQQIPLTAQLSLSIHH